MTKYGDQILETIEATIEEYYKTGKNKTSCSDSNDIKRKRDGSKVQNENLEADDFTKSTDGSKKRSLLKKSKTIEAYSYVEPDYSEFIDDDLDLYGYNFEVNASNTKADHYPGGRVLPQW